MQSLDDVHDPLDSLRKDRLLARERHDASSEFGCLATVDEEARPRARMVTLRTIDDRSVLVSAHLSSSKVLQLAENPAVELVVYWPTVLRQYRLEGTHEWVRATAVPDLFANAPWPARVWNWLHEEWPQSAAAPSRAALVEKFESMTAELEARYGSRAAIAPSLGAGYLRLIATRVEILALDVELRLHDRRVYLRENEAWSSFALVP